ETEEGNPQTQRDVSKIIDSIFAGIQYTRKPTTQPNVLLIDTLRNKPDEKKEEEKIISEEEAWGTEFDMFVEKTLAKQASRIGKRRGSEIPLVENSKAWGVTPTGKPLTPAPTSDTEKPQKQFKPKRNYRRPPPGIRWQDWKEHVDNLCEELEDKPKSEEEDEDQRPEETSKSEEEPVWLKLCKNARKVEKESDGKPLLAEEPPQRYSENSETHHSEPTAKPQERTIPEKQIAPVISC
ncbi:hypothetical protein ADUPG1_003221, partial [Aduncisulcus paluster]